MPNNPFMPKPNRTQLAKGRSPSGMPKLAKNSNYKPPKKKVAKRKPAKKQALVNTQAAAATPKKKALPPMRTHASLSRQAKEQPRNEQGQFVPVDQRGFLGKVGALFNGDMRRQREAEQAEIKKQDRALQRRLAKPEK